MAYCLRSFCVQGRPAYVVSRTGPMIAQLRNGQTNPGEWEQRFG